MEVMNLTPRQLRLRRTVRTLFWTPITAAGAWMVVVGFGSAAGFGA